MWQFSSVQSLSRVWLFVTPWNTARQPSLSITNSLSPPKAMSIESVMLSNHLTLCHPLLLLPPIFPSIRVFSNESALHIRCSKYWSFSFNISPSNEHPGLISFRMDWLDLLAVQGTLKSLFQHHSSKASILWSSVFYLAAFKNLSVFWQFCYDVCQCVFLSLSHLEFVEFPECIDLYIFIKFGKFLTIISSAILFAPCTFCFWDIYKCICWYALWCRIGLLRTANFSSFRFLSKCEILSLFELFLNSLIILLLAQICFCPH